LLLRLLLLSFSEVSGELGVVLLAFLLSSHMHSQFTALALNKPSSSIVLGYRTLEQACSPVSPGDATLTEEIHRLTRVTARGLHLPLQAADKRRRQGTQGQRQVGAGLRTEKVDIVYN